MTEPVNSSSTGFGPKTKETNEKENNELGTDAKNNTNVINQTVCGIVILNPSHELNAQNHSACVQSTP